MDKEFRLATARAALKGYDEWWNSPDPNATPNPQVLADLVSATRWLVEMLDQADVTVGEC